MNNLFDPRDRTQEFLSTVSAIKKQRGLTDKLANGTTDRLAPLAKHPTTDENHLHSNISTNGLPIATVNTSTGATATNGDNAHASLLANEPRTIFNQMAQQIGRKIHETTEKLEELAKIVKRDRSMFNDATASINSLTSDIRSSLKDVQTAVFKLAEMQRQTTTASKLGDNSWAQYSQNVVKQTKATLKNTTEQFAQVLQDRTNTLKEVNQRRKQFEGNASSAPLRKRAVHRHANAFDELLTIADESSSSSASASSSSTVSFSLSSSQVQDQIVAAPVQDSYYEARAEAVEQIERTVVELSAMYKQLSTLVEEQGEIALRIDSNLDTTLDHVERGQSELLKYFDRISSSRWLIIKIFAVLIAFIIFFMVFVA